MIRSVGCSHAELRVVGVSARAYPAPSFLSCAPLSLCERGLLVFARFVQRKGRERSERGMCAEGTGLYSLSGACPFLLQSGFQPSLE